MQDVYEKSPQNAYRGSFVYFSNDSNGLYSSLVKHLNVKASSAEALLPS